MLSLWQLFEDTKYAPAVQSPISVVRNFLVDKIHDLKRNFATGKVESPKYLEQLGDLQKDMDEVQRKKNQIMITR